MGVSERLQGLLDEYVPVRRRTQRVGRAPNAVVDSRTDRLRDQWPEQLQAGSHAAGGDPQLVYALDGKF